MEPGSALSYGGPRGSSISEGLNSLGWVQFGVFGFGVLEQLFLFMHVLNAFEFGVDLCGHAHRVKSRAKIHNKLSTGFVYPFCRRHRQCPPPEAATAPSVASPRADDRRSAPGRDATPLCPKGPEDGQDQEEEERDELNNAMRQTTPPPAGTQYFTMDDVSVPEQFGVRQAPVQEPGARAQEGIGRHTEVSFELVLDPVVPQLGEEESRATALQVMVADFMVEKVEAEREKRAEERRMKEINDRVWASIPISVVHMAAWRRWAGLPPSFFLHCGDKEEEEIAGAPMCAWRSLVGAARRQDAGTHMEMLACWTKYHH